MAKAGEYNFEIYQGAAIDEEIEWIDGRTNEPVDLSGWSARMQVRETVDSDEILFELGTEDDTIILGGVLGTIKLVAPPAVTSPLTFKRAEYDLFMDPPSNMSEVLLKGVIVLVKAVTR